MFHDMHDSRVSFHLWRGILMPNSIAKLGGRSVEPPTTATPPTSSVGGARKWDGPFFYVEVRGSVDSDWTLREQSQGNSVTE